MTVLTPSLTKTLIEIDQRERASKIYSHEVRSHELRVGRLAGDFGKHLRLEKSACQKLFWAGRFHDIGKLSIAADILFKNGGLEKHERHIVDTHTQKGIDLLSRDNLHLPSFLIAGISYHHEKYDGFGTHGLKGREIPLVARIISITDSFDAIKSKRSYKAEIDEVRALSIMVASSEIGQQCSYDPFLLRTFVHHKIKYLEKDKSPMLGVLRSYMKSDPNEVLERIGLQEGLYRKKEETQETQVSYCG
jgi:HD-GYP domain-containing protein (c-di-GMP phosphodiesterase class II)